MPDKYRSGCSQPTNELSPMILAQCSREPMSGVSLNHSSTGGPHAFNGLVAFLNSLFEFSKDNISTNDCLVSGSAMAETQTL